MRGASVRPASEGEPPQPDAAPKADAAMAAAEESRHSALAWPGGAITDSATTDAATDTPRRHGQDAADGTRNAAARPAADAIATGNQSYANAGGHRRPPS